MSYHTGYADMKITVESQDIEKTEKFLTEKNYYYYKIKDIKNTNLCVFTVWVYIDLKNNVIKPL